jgi:predicted AlkP superfamily pyrophosphatase or phosphodiesterase
MIKKVNFLFLLITSVLLFSCTLAFSQKNTQTNDIERPKLVVGIVVDQMRWDYLYRYYDRYGGDGFKRILNEGFSAENTYIDYVPTYTAIGHSTLYTGSVPSIHGIAGNDFIIQKTGETMYCTEDKDVLTVGSSTKAGLMSPKNLLSSTITDELKLATNFRSKVIGVAIKDRGSILPGGHLADASYWYDGSVGKWITSSWYMNELPTWVNKFNEQNLIEKYMSQGWNTIYPIETYVQSSKDNNEYEEKFKGTDAPVFPVNTAKLLKENGPGIITSTPYGNTFTFDMAKAAIENEELGQRGITDFLAMSLSSPDYIGHQFGPNSIEIEDNYLRLDKDLGAFLSYLDKTIGKDEYTVFLSADHGGAHNITFMQDNKMPAGAFGTSRVTKELNGYLTSVFKEEKLVLSLSNYQVHFNNTLIKGKGLDFEKIKLASIEFLKDQDGIAYVVDMEKAESASIPKIIRERIVNGYNHKRSGAIQIILEPAWYVNGSARPTGTTHGTWNPHDSHIPLLFMGWGINQGKISRPTNMTDLASTIAALLKIQEPNGNIGKPILEALKSESVLSNR